MTARLSPARARLALALLTLTYVVNFVDRQLIGILGQPMKAELGLSDRQLGMLGGLAFALFYTILGLPIARLAERRSRVGIIAASLGLLSAMTALCGIARSFPALLLARMGVGIGEAGCAPPAQSLISDMHPPERRATALAIFSLGVPIGMLIGAIGGGWIAQELGWRTAFVALGVPGLLLAAILGFVVPEPDRSAVPEATPPLGTVIRELLGNRAFVHMAAGASLASFAGYGITTFSVPMLVRSYQLTLAQAASGFGLVVGLAVGIGIGCGGWISDRLASRRADAPGLVAALGTLIAAALFQFALHRPSPGAVGAIAFLPLIGAHLYFGPTYGVTVNAVGPKSRATAIALLLMAMNAIGLGFGPLFVGTISDAFATACGGGSVCSAQGLERALRIDLLVYIWATVHFTLAARAMRAPAFRRFAHHA
jgi:predicted MFS family arabinose efflux permease